MSQTGKPNRGQNFWLDCCGCKRMDEGYKVPHGTQSVILRKANPTLADLANPHPIQPDRRESISEFVLTRNTNLPHLGAMQVRLDPKNADAVRREAQAHKRVFRRKCSFADVVNRMLTEAFERRNMCRGSSSNTVFGKGSVVVGAVQNAKQVFGWDNPK